MFPPLDHHQVERFYFDFENMQTKIEKGLWEEVATKTDSSLSEANAFWEARKIIEHTMQALRDEVQKQYPSKDYSDLAELLINKANSHFNSCKFLNQIRKTIKNEQKV